MPEKRLLAEISAVAGILPDLAEEQVPPKDQPAFLTNAGNVLIKNGRIEKLRGTDYLNSITSQQGIADYRIVLGLPIYQLYSGTKYLLAVTPQRLYYLKTNDQWFNLGTITNGGNDSILTYANINNKFVFTLSDSTFVWYWDGANFGKLFTPPTDDNLRARFLLGYNDTLYLFRTIETATEKYLRVRWSDAGDILTFSENSFLDVGLGAISNARLLGDRFVLYFPRQIYHAWWDGDGVSSGILDEREGLLAPRTLCGTTGRHFYLSPTGLMMLEYGALPQSVSDKKFNKFILDEIDPVYYNRAVAYFYSHLNHLYLAYPNSGNQYNTTQLIYDLGAQQLISKKTFQSGDSYSAYGEFEKDLSTLTPDERKNYGLSFVPIMGTKEGYIYEQKIIGYQDRASSYESFFTIPPIAFQSPERYKRILQLDLVVEKLSSQPITFTLEVSNDLNETWTYSFSLSATGSGLQTYELTTDANGNNVDFIGKSIRAKVKDVTNPEGWKIHALRFLGYFSTMR